MTLQTETPPPGEKRRELDGVAWPASALKIAEAPRAPQLEISTAALSAARPELPTLRRYQCQGVEEIRGAFRSGARRVLYQLPTGGGKTVVFVYIALSAMARGRRVLILVHRVELLEQAVAALEALGVAVGVIAPGAPETSHLVQIASVQTIARRRDRWRDAFDLVVVDEAHHSVAGSWARVIEAMPGAHILGVTATPERLDGRGLGDVFETMTEGPSVAELIAGGFLAPFRVFSPADAPDMTGAHIRAGDYAVEDLRERMGGVVIGGAVEEYQRLAPGLPAVAFCVDRAHSEAVAARFRAAGIAAAHVDGDTPSRERREAIAGLGNGSLSVVTNCGLISEGVDVPAIVAAILLRPTASLSLYLQQVGRALRPAPGKDRALILDFAGNTLRHRLPDAPREWSLESRPRRQREASTEERARQCKECGAVNAPRSATCCECGADMRTPRERTEIELRLREAEHARLRSEILSMSYPRRLAWAGRDHAKIGLVSAVCGYKRGWVFRRLQEIGGAA